MPKKQHQACSELQVYVSFGEEFEWVTDAEYCDVHIDPGLLDTTDYHVVNGTPTPATVIGPPGDYEFDCECKGKNTRRTNPHLIIT